MKIAACVSGRADYAPLVPVIFELEDKGAEVVAINAGFSGGSSQACCKSLADGIELLARRFEESRPDLILLLGDRYETLGAALAATLFGIPIAHIHGGETTEGSFDDGFRHAVTQLATYHFVSALEHAEIVARLTDKYHRPGLIPPNIHVVGAPGLDNIVDLPPREFKQPYFIVTYLPATKSDLSGDWEFIKALESFPEYDAIWTGVNNDPGSNKIRGSFEGGAFKFVEMHPKRYLSAVKHAACCIGNSSSFLIEAPALGVPSVNVGDRQKGRLKGPSVFQADENALSIRTAINIALAYKGPFDNPYGGPGASKRIAEILMAKDGISSVAA